MPLTASIPEDQTQPSSLSTFAPGRFAKLPFISGANLDEGTEQRLLRLPWNSQSQIRNYIAAALDRFLLLYLDDPVLGSSYGTGYQTLGIRQA
ncbi:uncharacterized protein EV420DRAFT_1642163 [Desarmillaria tabescens]|uniref:Uncharacterized protein n=1 Tax=Armillaria tabescens TaxID=1929756 RepID=A0AA39KG77_ARMTA|nr:uncharacterized protein EV420DRAFT_1642163 [Desarmillaria tabescens]KAK0459174.1 hypothetical protein EV420DRAFT_1642163 [Desarmillaria tabescens]